MKLVRSSLEISSKQSSLPDTEQPADKKEMKETQLLQASQWLMHCIHLTKRQQIDAVGVSTESLLSVSGSELNVLNTRFQKLSERVL